MSPLITTAWWNPLTLTTHLSERCARSHGRPAKEDAACDVLQEAAWCDRCSPLEKRIAIAEGRA